MEDFRESLAQGSMGAESEIAPRSLHLGPCAPHRKQVGQLARAQAFLPAGLRILDVIDALAAEEPIEVFHKMNSPDLISSRICDGARLFWHIKALTTAATGPTRQVVARPCGTVR